MGTRAQVKVKDGSTHPVYLYQDWDGYNLADTVRDALKRGESQWHDACYLTRIIFSEMIRDSVDGLTGYGIDTVQHGDIEYLVTVDVKEQTVEVESMWRDRRSDEKKSFARFVGKPPHPLTLADLTEEAVKRLGFDARQHAFNSVNKARRERGDREYEVWSDVPAQEVYERSVERDAEPRYNADDELPF